MEIFNVLFCVCTDLPIGLIRSLCALLCLVFSG